MVAVVVMIVMRMTNVMRMVGVKVLVTLEALTPPCRDTFCRHAAPGAWPESARMREIRQKGIYTFIHSSFHES